MSKHEIAWANMRKPSRSFSSFSTFESTNVISWPGFSIILNVSFPCFPGFNVYQASFSRMILFILEYAVRYLLVPGRVENWVLLVDLTGCGLSMAASSTFRAMSAVHGEKRTGDTSYEFIWYTVCIYIYIYMVTPPNRGLPWVFLVVFAVKHIYFIVQLLVWFSHYHTSTVQFNSCFLAVPQLPPGYSTS